MCHNISVEERKGLKNLCANQDIIIKETDKGSTVVIMNTSYYEKKIKSIFTNLNTYKNCLQIRTEVLCQRYAS